MQINPDAADTLLLVSPGCPHCAKVLQALGELVKEGAIGRLEVINVAVHPERAAELGVRSAPWSRIGDFELPGAQAVNELREWARLAGSPDGATRYLEQLLGSGGLKEAERYVAKDPQRLAQLLPLIADPESRMQVRLGAGALLEGADSPALKALLPEFERLTQHADHRVRGDACHYLGLTREPAARAALQRCLEDENPEVREIASEALEELANPE